MDYLILGFIGDMYGPHFLVLYACVIAVTLVFCRWAVRTYDRTGDLPPLPVPEDPDPYEIAYLRGGENELARLVIFDLIQRGYLQVVEEPRAWWQGKAQPELEQVANHPELRHLTPTQRDVFDAFSSPRKAAEIFRGLGLPDRIKRHCREFDERFAGEQLLSPAAAQEAAWGIGAFGTLMIGGLGGYKLLAALAKGRTNVGFLILMGIVGLVILLFICKLPRLSRRGQDYLCELHRAFENLKEQPTITSLSAPAYDPTLLLLVGLFGVGMLTETPYDYFEEMFHKSAGGGTLGAGCGGGCGGGGFGGGGCGGCGGGGCGGG